MSDPRTFRVIGSAMAVHRKLGPGFLEAVYQEALARQFAADGIPFEREVAFPVIFDGARLAVGYRADFVCFGDVLVETKALRVCALPEHAQVLNYLKASGLEIGLLLNFGTRSLEFRRFIHTRKPPAPAPPHPERRPATGESVQSA